MSSTHNRIPPIKPLMISGIIWLIFALVLAWKIPDSREASLFELKWTFLLSALCLLDLLALGKLVGIVFQLTAGTAENRSGTVIQAFYWGTLKLVCIGILIALLAQGESIPKLGMLLGLGTLTVVPLFGGIYWHRRSRYLEIRDLPHA